MFCRSTIFEICQFAAKVVLYYILKIVNTDISLQSFEIIFRYRLAVLQN